MNKFLKSLPALLPFLLLVVAASSQAQVRASADRRPFSLTAGGMLSVYNPGYGPNDLGGYGAYADLRLTRWIGIEGETHWLRLHQFQNIHEDLYDVGLRAPLPGLWRAHPYVKALVGAGYLNFEENLAKGRYTDLTFGAGVDVRINRKFTLRAINLEYHDWPDFLGTSAKPNGADIGLSYRIF